MNKYIYFLSLIGIAFTVHAMERKRTFARIEQEVPAAAQTPQAFAPDTYSILFSLMQGSAAIQAVTAGISEQQSETPVNHALKKVPVQRDVKVFYTVADMLAACQRGDYASVALLAEQGFVNVVNADGWTPLHAAVASDDNLRITCLLLSKRALLNFPTLSGVTPLHWALKKGAYKQVALLTLIGALKGHKDEAGRTIFHLAAEDASLGAQENFSFWNFLLTSDPQYLPLALQIELTALIKEFKHGDRLVPVANQDLRGISFLNCADIMANTPLSIAIELKNKLLIQYLIVRGAVPRLRTQQHLGDITLALAHGEDIYNTLILLIQQMYGDFVIYNDYCVHCRQQFTKEVDRLETLAQMPNGFVHGRCMSR